MSTVFAQSVRRNSFANTAPLQCILQQAVQMMRQGKSTGIDAIDCFTNDLVVRKTNKWRTLKERLAPTGGIEATTTLTTTQHQRNASALTGHAGQMQSACAGVETMMTISSLPAQYTLAAAAKRILLDLQGIRHASDIRQCVDVQTLSAPHIDQLLLSTLLSDAVLSQPHRPGRDFYAMLSECVRWRKLPSETVLIDCLQYLTRYAAHLTYAEQLMRLAAEENATMFAAHAGFVHYRARARWHRGEHADALREWREAYATMRTGQLVQMAGALRRFLRETVQLTFGEDCDETVAELVLQTAQYLSARYGENEMLMSVWQCCFVSEWFERQQRAVRMFNECEEIRSFVGQKTSVLCYNLLREHKVDTAHRLIELFLKFNMKNDCRTCLSILFDYQYWRRDLRACSEIMRSSLDIDAPLSEAHNQKLLNLLLGSAPQPLPRKSHADRVAQQTKFEMKF